MSSDQQQQQQQQSKKEKKGGRLHHHRLVHNKLYYLYEDTCYQLLRRFYERIKVVHDAEIERTQFIELGGNNRIPVLPGGGIGIGGMGARSTTSTTNNNNNNNSIVTRSGQTEAAAAEVVPVITDDGNRSNNNNNNQTTTLYWMDSSSDDEDGNDGSMDGPSKQEIENNDGDDDDDDDDEKQSISSSSSSSSSDVESSSSEDEEEMDNKGRTDDLDGQHQCLATITDADENDVPLDVSASNDPGGWAVSFHPDYDTDDVTASDTHNNMKTTKNGGDRSNLTTTPTKKKNTKRGTSSKDQKRHQQAIQQHSANLIRLDFELDEVDPETGHPLHIFPPAALLSRTDLRTSDMVSHARTILQLSESMVHKRQQKRYVVVLLLQSGRFAGGVFDGSTCIVHRALSHYTVRKGQGKAQSSQDQKRRPKSVGSQLRRAGELAHKVDVQKTMTEWWSDYITQASLIFVSCPKTMQSTIFCTSTGSSTDGGGGGGGTTTAEEEPSSVVVGLLRKDDDRVRKIPFDAGRPTFDSVKVVHQVMLGVEVRAVEKYTHPDQVQPSSVDDSDARRQQQQQQLQQQQQEEEKEKARRAAIDIPLTPLHEAAKNGNLVALLDVLRKMTDHQQDDVENSGDDIDHIIIMDVNQRAGYDRMTPLHFAAASSTEVDPSTAAACVSTLLVQARADPTILDGRGRPPYFMATHDRVREAFRKARAVLGEDYCRWDVDGKVGPPLTDDDVVARKNREAEKKKRKKARQKEQKAKDDAHAQEMEERRKVEEEKARHAEEAKRVRDGLSAKPTGGNVCDYCQKKCIGKKKNQMFLRLEYKYCSSDCVNAHKRELMAAAALARFGG